MADTLREEAVAIPQVTWIGGVQDFLPQHMTGETAAKELLNCEVTNHGTVRRRGGMRLLRSFGTVTGPLLLLKSFHINTYRPSLVSLFQSVPGSTLIKIDDGNEAISVTGPFAGFTDRCDIVQVLDRIYFLEPGQRPHFWVPGETTLQQEIGPFSSGMPNVGTLAYFQGRCWAGGETAKPDLVYFSFGLDDAAANEDQFTWDQQGLSFRMHTGPVEGILAFRNVILFVFTRYGIETIEMNPNSVLDSGVSVLSEEIGLATKHTLRLCGEDVFFMDQFGHVRSLKQTELDESRGITNVPLSQPIKNVIDRQNKGRLSASRAVFHDGVYYVGWPRESSMVADEWWGFSIRDRAWFGPNYFQRDELDDEHLIPTTIGGFASHRFELEETHKLYVFGKTVTNTAKVWDLLDPLVMDDDGVLIPVRITTKAYQPIPATRIGWRNLEVEFRFRHSEHDATVDVALEGRLDEGRWQTIGTVTVSPDATPALPENLPFTLTPYQRQRLKNSIAGFDQSYSWQNRATIRDRLTRFEIIQQLVSGYVENQNYAR